MDNNHPLSPILRAKRTNDFFMSACIGSVFSMSADSYKEELELALKVSQDVLVGAPDVSDKITTLVNHFLVAGGSLAILEQDLFTPCIKAIVMIDDVPRYSTQLIEGDFDFTEIPESEREEISQIMKQGAQ